MRWLPRCPVSECVGFPKAGQRSLTTQRGGQHRIVPPGGSRCQWRCIQSPTGPLWLQPHQWVTASLRTRTPRTLYSPLRGSNSLHCNLPDRRRSRYPASSAVAVAVELACLVIVVAMLLTAVMF